MPRNLNNGRFLDVASGKPLPAGTRLHLSEGRIAAIGPVVPGADEEIDLEGRTVIPGLVNTHAHVAISNPGLVLSAAELWTTRRLHERQVAWSLDDCVRRGVTTVRDALVTDLRVLASPKSRPAPRVVQSVHVAPLGGAFAPRPWTLERVLQGIAGMSARDYGDRQSGILALPPDASEQAMRDAVDRAIDERGAGTIKLYDQAEYSVTYRKGAAVFGVAQLAAAVDQARERGKPVTLHHMDVAGLRRGVAAGVTSLAHLACDAPLTDADLEAFVKSGCILEPTFTLAYFYCWGGQGVARDNVHLPSLDAFRAEWNAKLAKGWIPELRPVFLGNLSRLQEGRTRSVAWLEMGHALRYMSGVLNFGADNLKRLWEAGATLALGNDAGACSVGPGALHLELAMLSWILSSQPCARPFTPLDGLRAATLHGARALGNEGNIVVGAPADLAVLDGDPLTDLAAIGAPKRMVIVNGEIIDLAS